MVAALDVFLAACAFQMFFSVCGSRTSEQGGTLGLATIGEAAIMLSYVGLSILHLFLQHNAGSTGYSTISATMLMYFGRMIICCFMFVTKGNVRAGLSTMFTLSHTKLGKVPNFVLPLALGCLFSSADALSFISLVSLDAVTYQILLQLRAILVGILWQIMLRRKLSNAQWLAFVLFAAAGLTKGLDRTQLMGAQGFAWNFSLMLIQICMGAFANVYSEVILKDLEMPTDLLLVCQYLWGLVWLMVVLMYWDGYAAVYSELFSATAWTKLRDDPWMIAAICCMIVFGIVTAYLLKKLSNIVKELSGGPVIIISTIAEWLIYPCSAMRTLDVMGVSMAVLSIVVYSMNPLKKDVREASVDNEAEIG